MPPSRRALLRAAGPAVALAGLAGCTAGYRTTVPDSEPRHCPDEPRMPEPDPHPDGADLPPVPDPPGSLADDAVTSYAHDYELAWAWRAATKGPDGPVEEVALGARLETVERIRDASLVQYALRPLGRVYYEFTESDGPGHFDASHRTVAYLVTHDAAWRESTPSPGVDEPPVRLDPLRNGQLVHCF